MQHCVCNNIQWLYFGYSSTVPLNIYPVTSHHIYCHGFLINDRPSPAAESIKHLNDKQDSAVSNKWVSNKPKVSGRQRQFQALPIIRTDYARAMHSYIRTTEGLKASTWQTKDNMAGHVDLQPANIGLFTACQPASPRPMYVEATWRQPGSQPGHAHDEQHANGTHRCKVRLHMTSKLVN